MKNYGLERLVPMLVRMMEQSMPFDAEQCWTRYLIKDGSSISKGVDVLEGAVSD
jgi:hypothetical protein